MNCKDLMVGDLVQGHLPNTPSKVVGIPNEYRLAVITQGGAYMELSIDDFLPIPITQEILEKNFPDTKEGVMWWPHNKDVFFIGTETDRKITFCGLFYFVHQLQHALRLCGIEKEIVL